MIDDADTLAPEPTSTPQEPLTSTRNGSEPTFIARARRILGGDVRPDDYLPVPEVVHSAVADEETRLREVKGFTISDEFRTRIRNDWTLQFIHGGQPVACRRTDAGVIVFAVGTEEIRTLLERFPRPDQRSVFFITTPPTWQTPNLTDSPNLSPQLLPHSG
ncbi:MAG TPA: hypothetical protein VG097_07370 [Gemmata sp.]|jgi:hypothetical protein|nr:hypothetical protein [Gemmata sp.]